MPTTLQPGDMLPVRRLRPLDGGDPVPIGSNRPRAQVLVLSHTEPCERCLAYIDSLEAVAEAVRTEKGDVLALVGASWNKNDCSALPVPAVVADDVTVEALSPEKTPVVAVVDRFGQLFRRLDVGHGHAFPDHDQILPELVDIAIRCPECGVPDVPSPDLLPEEGVRSGGMVLGQ